MKPGDLYRCNELTAQSEGETLFKIVSVGDDTIGYVTFGSDEESTTRLRSEFEQLFTLVGES